MPERSGRITMAALLSGTFLLSTLGALGGCIAVSRETRRDVAPSPGGAVVLAGGQWEADQVWQCQPAPDFVLFHERTAFQSRIDERLDRGWEIADFDVVSIPATADESEQVCLVGTFRRWVEDESS